MLQGIANSVNKDKERKRVLVAANQDSISITKSHGAIDPNNLSLKIVAFVNPLGTISGTLLSIGLSSTQNITIRQNIDGKTLVVIMRGAGGVFLISATGIFPTAQVYTIEVINRELFVDGISKGVISDCGIITPDDTTYPLTFGRRIDSAGADFWMDGELHNVEFDGETYLLNEGNGAETVGSNGSIGTLNTIHIDGLEYINFDVIKPI